MEPTALVGAVRRVRTSGAKDISRRIARRVTRFLASTFDTTALEFPLLSQDIADSTRLRLDPPRGTSALGEPLHLAWICTPPGAGSGGHTTLFRMLEGMEMRGHRCSLLLYDRHNSDPAHAASVIRTHWPQLQADIRPVPRVIEGFDGSIASSWETAHVLASRGQTSMHRFYFIQDFEPFFYPRGSLYSLAEDTYRFGFRNIALGDMVAGALKDNIGVDSASVPFGCDTSVYRLENLGRRDGVVFYARETVDRRGFLLGKLALEEFHERHPEQTIHVYGDAIVRWETPHTHHGRLSPRELNHLYNSTIAGLAMSLTNISLVAEEMLACGMTPVVNAHPYAHADLDSPYVQWAPPTPGGLADALCHIVEQPQFPTRAPRIAASARRGWTSAQSAVARIIEAEVAACRI